MLDEMNYVVDPETGEIVDPETGEVKEEHPIDGQHYEYRLLNIEKLFRAHHYNRITFTMHDHGMFTVISSTSRRRNESWWYFAKHRAKIEEHRRRLLQAIRRSYKDRNDRKTMRLINLHKEMLRICDILKIPQTAMETAGLYLKKIAKVTELRKDMIPLIAGAAVYYAARAHNLPVLLRDIADVIGVDAKYFKRFVGRLMYNHGILPNRATHPAMFIDRVCSELGLSQKVSLVARLILRKLEEAHVVIGKSPYGILSAIAYVASIIMNEKQTQDEIAKKLHISSASIRYNYSRIVENLDITIKL